MEPARTAQFLLPPFWGLKSLIRPTSLFTMQGRAVEFKPKVPMRTVVVRFTDVIDMSIYGSMA